MTFSLLCSAAKPKHKLDRSITIFGKIFTFILMISLCPRQSHILIRALNGASVEGVCPLELSSTSSNCLTTDITDGHRQGRSGVNSASESRPPLVVPPADVGTNSKWSARYHVRLVS